MNIFVFCNLIFFLFLGIFQEDSSEGADLRVSREQELPDRQEAEEPVPVLQIQQVHRHRHEEGGRAGGEAARQQVRITINTL